MIKWLKNFKKKRAESRIQEPIGGFASEDSRLHKNLSKEEESIVERAVERTVEEYGEALKKMGNE